MSTILAEPQPPKDQDRPPLKKKDIAADHPTWCPGCGDFSVLAFYFKLIEKKNLWQEKITTVAGIGCSSRFPYFVQGHGVHFIHGRALPFATGISLTRPDLHLFVFSGDGDAFSIGGNHLNHAARKNVNLTYVIMDNQVYGLTKKQTSPTSPLGFKSKTDMWGSVDRPINPMKQLIGAGATFIARTTATNPKHLMAAMEAALDHNGFSVIECLSECTEFFAGAFDATNPRKGGDFMEVPKDHDVTNESAAYKLAEDSFPGYFGTFYDVETPTKNEKEAEIIEKLQSKVQGMKDWEILKSNFDKMK
ncbi:MAG TPA: pyruvate ferredoxin oxidoreductase [Verrucomicrobiales bacterium]|jgi:2-oxoglutarate ferredoxin oxidoreductase subunit beta|nr:pyruvate ferredoxin oxidoreductase [Verrucomicrobiales bacterium]HIL69477.1 pyruvate ferredoxin oxidoreductase [Verrucomicrobiota bacterium]